MARYFPTVQDVHRVEVIGSQRDMVGESPVWKHDTAELFWVDIDGKQLRCLREQRIVSWPLPERAGCIVVNKTGGLLAAMETGIFQIRFGAAHSIELTLLAAANFPKSGMRFNDGKVDRRGRLWCSSMSMDLSGGATLGALYRLDDRGLQVVYSGLVTGNGLGFSPDGQTLYLSDSHHSVRKIWRFALSENGEIADQTDLCDMAHFAGRPDGAAIDAAGSYWSCGNDAGVLHEISPEGRFLQKIALPAAKPSMCVFGGSDLRSLYVTSISLGQSDMAAGCLMRLQAPRAGLVELPYSF